MKVNELRGLIVLGSKCLPTRPEWGLSGPCWPSGGYLFCKWGREVWGPCLVAAASGRPMTLPMGCVAATSAPLPGGRKPSLDTQAAYKASLCHQYSGKESWKER